MPVVISFEEGIQAIDETFFSTHVPDQSGYILRRIPGVVIRRPFADKRSGSKRIERFDPSPVGMASTGVAGFWIDDVPVVFRPFDEHIIIISFT